MQAMDSTSAVAGVVIGIELYSGTRPSIVDSLVTW